MGDFIFYGAILVLYGFVIYKLYKFCCKETPPIDFVQAKEIIERLSSNQNKLNNIEDLLTTSQLHDDDYTQDIKCTWSSADKQHGCTFEMSNTSDHFKDMAVEERDRLRKDLLSDIERLCDLRRYGVTQSVTLTDEETAGECPEPESGEGSEEEKNTEGEGLNIPITGTSIQYPDHWYT